MPSNFCSTIAKELESDDKIALNNSCDKICRQQDIDLDDALFLLKLVLQKWSRMSVEYKSILGTCSLRLSMSLFRMISTEKDESVIAKALKVLTYPLSNSLKLDEVCR